MGKEGRADMIISKRGDWLAARVGPEILMMSTEKGLYLGLSETGARIWELVDTLGALEPICRQLEAEFEVAPDVCENEVRTFLDELAKHGVIDPVPPPSEPGAFSRS
jgi:hypothetical protein